MVDAEHMPKMPAYYIYEGYSGFRGAMSRCGDEGGGWMMLCRECLVRNGVLW